MRSRDPRLLAWPDGLLIVPVEKESPPSRNRQAVLTVFPTTGCNLRCSYCYASSGGTKKNLSFPQFQTLLLDVLNPARFSHMELRLHGGGEPTLHPELFRNLVREFTQRCRMLYIEPSCTLTTNGTFGALALSTIEEFSIACSISWDGADDIQHRQRPFASGENSHPVVFSNIRTLARAKLLRRVRITVTPDNIDRLLDSIHLLHQEGVSRVHVEPLSILGRQKQSDRPGIAVEQYAKQLQKAYILCCQLGMELQASSVPLFRRPTGRACGAFGWNFVLTPWGEISACSRVQQQSDDHADAFLLGPWVPGADPITFGQAKRKKLQQRVAENLTDCAGCPLLHHCAGGCPMSIPASYDGALHRTDDLPCELATRCCDMVLAAVRQGSLPPGWECLRNEP